MHDPDDFQKLAEHYSAAAKACKTASHKNMLDNVARFYASLILSAAGSGGGSKAEPPAEITTPTTPPRT